MDTAMNKPTVFLSHSSRDAKILIAIKDLLKKKTADTLRLFLSSDGQSIPFGRNWVATVENALDNTALMFSFLTPQSLTSSWVNFEAGYAYARGVHVVPIATLGLAMERVHPPLSLLQGFNLSNYNGLNNILYIINERFTTKYELSFTDLEYEAVFGASVGTADTSLRKFSRLVDSVEIVYAGELEACQKALAAITANIADAAQTEKGITSYGFNATLYDAGKQHSVKLEITPELIRHYAPIVLKAYKEADALPGRIAVNYDSTVYLRGQSWRLTSRFFGTEIKLISGQPHYQGKPFILRSIPRNATSHRVVLTLSYEMLGDIDYILRLNDLLWELDVLGEQEYGF